MTANFIAKEINLYLHFPFWCSDYLILLLLIASLWFYINRFLLEEILTDFHLRFFVQLWYGLILFLREIQLYSFSCDFIFFILFCFLFSEFRKVIFTNFIEIDKFSLFVQNLLLITLPKFYDFLSLDSSLIEYPNFQVFETFLP